MARRWNNDKNSFVRISSEGSIYKDLNEFKEAASFVVYNVGNMLNHECTTFVRPIELESLNSNLLEYIVSAGIYSLYENYLIFKSKYIKGSDTGESY